MNVNNRKFSNFAVAIWVFVMFFVGGCNHKCPTQPKEDSFWHKVSDIDLYSENIFNSKGFDSEYFYTVTDLGLYLHFVLDQQKPYSVSIIYSIFSGELYKPLITSNFTTYIEDAQRSRVQIIAHNNHYSKLLITPEYFGEQFKEFSFKLDPFQEYFASINAQNRFVSVITKSDKYGTENYIVYADLYTIPWGNFSIVNHGYWLITSISDSFINIRGIINFQDKTYIFYEKPNNGYSGLITVSENEEINEIECNFPFMLSNIRFFIHNGKLLVTDDLHRLWFTLDGVDWGYIGSYKMSKWYGNEDFLLCVDNNTIIIYENYFCDQNKRYSRAYQSNIKGLKINSVNNYGNSLVITTNKGIYYKPLEDFFWTKE